MAGGQRDCRAEAALKCSARSPGGICRGRGQPLGHLSTRQKHCVSDILSTGFYRSSSNRLRRPDPNLGFHCVNRIFAGLARRGDPFSQPSGSSAFLADALVSPEFEPKGADGIAPALLPPARFSWSTILLPHALVLASACVHQRCAQTGDWNPRCAHQTSGMRRITVENLRLDPFPLESFSRLPKSCLLARLDS